MIILVIVIIVIYLAIKIFKLKPDIEKTLRNEYSLLEFITSNSKNNKNDDLDSESDGKLSGDFGDTARFLKSSSELNPSKVPRGNNTRRSKRVGLTKNYKKISVLQEILKNPKETELLDSRSSMFVHEEETNKKPTRDKMRRSGSKTSTYKREEECRTIIENYFDDYFPTCRPNFLSNPLTGKPLELDGYNARLNLAFEHQGRQHREYPNAFHKTEAEFLKQQERDEFKRKKLSELGIDLIEISDTVPYTQLKAYIHRSLQSLGHSPHSK